MSRLTTLLSAPSGRSWKAICEMIDTWPVDATRDEAIKAVDIGMEAWPQKEISMFSGWPIPNRTAPSAWGRKLKKGVVPTGWPLVRFLQYHSDWLKPADLTAILSSGQLTRITHLYFGMNSLKPPLLGALADAADALPALEAISLYGNAIPGDRMADFLGSADSSPTSTSPPAGLATPTSSRSLQRTTSRASEGWISPHVGSTRPRWMP